MKRASIQIVKICFITSFSFSCNRTEKAVKHFPSVQDVKSVDIPVNEIIKFLWIYKLQDYVILQDGSANVDMFFYVYKYPGFQFLYSFAKKGQGPDEYLLPTVVTSTPGNYFSFRDHGKNILTTFQLSDTICKMIYSGSMSPENGLFFNGIDQVDDSLFLIKRENAKWTRRELINLYTKEIIDSIPNTFDLEKKLGKDYYTTFETTYITSNNKRFAYAYILMNLIEFGVIHNNKIIITNRVGIKRAPDFHLYGSSDGRNNFNLNILHYHGLTCGDKYVYALYLNVPSGEIRKNEHSTQIEVYTWDGTPVALLKLNKNISHFVVDEERQMIIGFNYDISQDYLHTFKFHIEE